MTNNIIITWPTSNASSYQYDKTMTQNNDKENTQNKMILCHIRIIATLPSWLYDAQPIGWRIIYPTKKYHNYTAQKNYSSNIHQMLSDALFSK